ncbi:P-type conjugative transfer protein TrbJ [Novosphingobium sp. TCA1]|uniref:P-type conjugative transfer protein TrbJ n=1 Tax=Novosphingobium sp. TCA1 TaxID=2682474 RepID=UPI001308533F|nr:P-type conjugative transfer protein TrbJ [Novosphingobium sp. TCA1]GFE77050.1 conjugal transfer protein TrbJ [Novosphingobium sp. TCA1]
MLKVSVFRRRHRCAIAQALLAVSAVGAGIGVHPAPAHALVVYDPTNHAQNVLTAARALQQVNNQIQSLQNQAQSLVNQARNLSSVRFPELQALTDTLRKIDVLMGQAQGIEFKVASADQQFAQLYPDAYRQSLKLDDRVAASRARMDAQVAAYRKTVTLQAQIAENVAADAATLNSLVERSQGAEGALQVQQAANQLLALTAKQQFQIQQMMAAQYRADAVRESNRAQEAAEAQAATTKFLGSGSAYTPN